MLSISTISTMYMYVCPSKPKSRSHYVAIHIIQLKVHKLLSYLSEEGNWFLSHRMTIADISSDHFFERFLDALQR